MGWNQGGGGSIIDLGGVPVADVAGVTIETTADPINGGTMSVLTFPEDQTAIAIQLAGAAFPNTVIASDSEDGWYFSDGTIDPYNDGHAYLRVASDALAFGDVIFNHDNQFGADVKFGVGKGLKWPDAAAAQVHVTAATLVVQGGADGLQLDAQTGNGITIFGRIGLITGDIVFTDATVGPVVTDSSDGHTYRLGTTAGVVTATLVT